MGAQDLQRTVGVPLGHEGGKSAFAGDLQRIKAENFTGCADVLADGD